MTRVSYRYLIIKNKNVRNRTRRWNWALGSINSRLILDNGIVFFFFFRFAELVDGNKYEFV